MSSEGKNANFVFTKENFRNPTLPTGLRVVEVCVRSFDCFFVIVEFLVNLIFTIYLYVSFVEVPLVEATDEALEG